MKFRLIALVLVFLLAFASCGKKTDTEGVNLKLEIQPETVTDELYVKMNYEYTVTEKFTGLAGDYVTFVHFWRVKSKEMLLGDDHTPAKKISEWKSGDKISYSREVFIPKFLDEFDIDFEGYEIIRLTVGIYLPGDENSKVILAQKDLEVHAASLNAPEIVYDEGWWQVETDLKIKKPGERTWRWTTKRAVCIIENRGKDCLLIISGRVDKIQFADQKVIFKINDEILDEFIPEKDCFEKKYIVTPEKMGQKDEFILAVETDKTFTPSAAIADSKDSRELGVRIFRIYFRENIK